MVKKKLIVITNYPEFTRLYKLMLVRIFYNDQKALLSWGDDAAINEYLQTHTEFKTANGYSSWCKGDFVGDQPLSLENFKGFILENLGDAGSPNYAFLQNLVKSGPSRYLPLLDEPEILKLKKKESSFKKDNGRDSAARKNPVPFWVPIPDKKIIGREILGKIPESKKTSIRALLTGCPGSGKSTVLKVMAYTKYLTTYDQIIWVDASSINSLQSSLTLAQANLLPEHEIRIGLPIKNQLEDLLQVLRKQKVILLVENCHSRAIYEMIVNNLPPEFDSIFEMKRSELAYEIDPGGKTICHVGGFSPIELEIYWKAIASKGKNMNREVFDRLCEQVGNNPEELFLALGEVASYGPDLALQEFASLPSKSILERVFQFLTPEQKKRMMRMGALPHLLSYDNNVFTALWECDEQEARHELIRFAGLNWVEELLDESGWKISKSVLEYAANLLVEVEAEEMQRADQWLKRIDLKGLKIKFSDQHRIGLREFLQLLGKGPKLHPNFLFRTASQFLNPVNHNTYWNLFKGSESWMRSEEWLAARYLYQKDVNTFRWARGISVFFIFISLLGDDTLPVKDVVAAILISPILLLLLVSIIFLTPWLRNSEAISLQIWHAVQERRGEGE